MRAAAAVALLTLVLAGFFVERRASLCGAGLLPTNLPYGLHADWFNGTFWLTDSEGWGVIAPPVELEVSGEADLPVRWMNRYTTEHGFIAEVALESGETTFVALERPVGSSIRKTRLTPEALQQRAGAKIDGLCWVDVRPRSCFFGMFWAARVLVAAALAGVVVVAIRSGKRA
jgi:hypothetical protein